MTLLVFFMVLLAATLHALWNFVAKQSTGNLSVMWLGICLATVLSWPWALLVSHAERLTLDGLPYIAVTGVLHAGYFGFLARSYKTGDISLVYPVARGTGVAGTALVAWLFLHETLSLPGAMGILAICAGTALIGYHKVAPKTESVAYGHALLVGAIITGYSVVDKLAVGHIHPVTYISGMFSLSAFLLAPYVLRRQRLACRYAYRHLKKDMCLIGIGSIATYLLILFAFRLGQVSYIVATREFAIVIGSFLGFLVLKEPLTVRKIIGITAITLGLMLVRLG